MWEEKEKAWEWNQSLHYTTDNVWCDGSRKLRCIPGGAHDFIVHGWRGRRSPRLTSRPPPHTPTHPLCRFFTFACYFNKQNLIMKMNLRVIESHSIFVRFSCATTPFELAPRLDGVIWNSQSRTSEIWFSQTQRGCVADDLDLRGFWMKIIMQLSKVSPPPPHTTKKNVVGWKRVSRAP